MPNLEAVWRRRVAARFKEPSEPVIMGLTSEERRLIALWVNMRSTTARVDAIKLIRERTRCNLHEGIKLTNIYADHVRWNTVWGSAT